MLKPNEFIYPIHIQSFTNQASKYKALLKRVQGYLCAQGWLDPVIKVDPKTLKTVTIPADGIYGPVTENAIRSWADYHCLWSNEEERLPESFFESISVPRNIVYTPGDPASDIVLAMISGGYWVSCAPKTFNIVYLERTNPDFTINANERNRWNDLRMVIKIDDNMRPVIVGQWVATTEPGEFYTQQPMNVFGAARIAFGQYKAWASGVHNGKQPALRQVAPILVYRDLDKNGNRRGDSLHVSYATINQHSTNENFNSEYVGKHSAGCLVGKYYQEHLEFLSIVLSDRRFLRNNAYNFISTVMDGKPIFGNDTE